MQHWISSNKLRLIILCCCPLISRRTETSRGTSGMVCLRRIVGKTILSNYVRLHRKLLGNRYSFLCFDLCSGRVNSDFIVQQRYSIFPIKLTLPSACAAAPMIEHWTVLRLRGKLGHSRIMSSIKCRIDSKLLILGLSRVPVII